MRAIMLAVSCNTSVQIEKTNRLAQRILASQFTPELEPSDYPRVDYIDSHESSEGRL
jgi:hypothetical protein